VLVHCRAGVSRSATIVVAYVMKSKGWTLKESLSFVKKQRAIISPNHGFLSQLVLYEKLLFNGSTSLDSGLDTKYLENRITEISDKVVAFQRALQKINPSSNEVKIQGLRILCKEYEYETSKLKQMGPTEPKVISLEKELREVTDFLDKYLPAKFIATDVIWDCVI